MADDILQFLGIKADPQEHPADKDTLSFLGLKPHKPEHPAYTDPYNLGKPEDRGPDTSAKSTLQKVHEAISPTTVIPAVASDVGRNVKDYATTGAGMAIQGASDVMAGQPATGVGHVALGAAMVPLSLLAGPVKSGQNALTNVTGNPDFADKAALMVPFSVGRAGKVAAHAVAPSTRAADEAIRMAGPDAPEMIRRMQDNPRLRGVDVSDPLRVGAQGLVDPAQPNAMAAVVNSAKRSAETAKDAVKGIFDTAMGKAPNVVDEFERLTKAAQTVGQTKIQPVLNAAKPVDLSSVIKNMDDVIKPGVQAVASPGTQITPTALQSRLTELRRDLSDGRSVLTDPQRIHTIQSDLRREAEELMSSATGSERRLGRQLMDVRNQLVDRIEASGSGYKEGLAAFRDAKDVEKAFEDGRKIFVNSEDVKTYPQYLEKWVKGASSEELAAKRLGVRDAAERKMAQFQYAARRGTDIPEIDFNRRKIEMLFDKEQTDRMFKLLKDERDIALSNQRILHNSKTAETLAAREHLKLREVTPPSGHLPSWAMGMGGGAGLLTQSPQIGAAVGAGVLGLSGLKSGAQYLGRRADISRNASFADLVTRNDPETIAQLVAAIDRANRRNKFSHLLAPP